MFRLSSILEFELIRFGRGKWHWWLRAIYGGLLWWFLYLAFNSNEVISLLNSGAPLRGMKLMATNFYEYFRFTQLCTVILLSPVFAANSLSEEKTRRTLEFLLATPLRTLDIVGNKFLMSVLRVWEIVLTGLPLCALCFLFGGISPGQMIADFSIAMCAAVAGCGLAMFVALFSRRLTDALLATLLINLVWYCSPLVLMLLQSSGANFKELPWFMVDWNSFFALSRTGVQGMVAPLMLVWDALAATVSVGIVAVTITWLSLRHTWDLSHRKSESRIVRFFQIELTRKRSSRRASRSVTDPPMDWRELKQRPFSTIERVGLCLVVTALVIALVIEVTYWTQARASVADLMTSGQYGRPPLITTMGMLSSLFYLGFVGLPGIAVIAATAFAEERDQQLFDVLRSTDLSQEEIIRGKLKRINVTAFVLLSPQLFLMCCSCLIGWTTWTAAAILTANLFAATALAVLCGVYLALSCERTSRAVMTALIGTIVVCWIIPVMVLMVDNSDDSIVFIGFSSPFMGLAMVQMDTTFARINASYSHFDILEFRFSTILWTIALVAISAGVFKRLTLPIGPWEKKLAHADILSDRPFFDPSTIQRAKSADPVTKPD